MHTIILGTILLGSFDQFCVSSQAEPLKTLEFHNVDPALGTGFAAGGFYQPSSYIESLFAPIIQLQLANNDTMKAKARALFVPLKSAANRLLNQVNALSKAKSSGNTKRTARLYSMFDQEFAQFRKDIANATTNFKKEVQSRRDVSIRRLRQDRSNFKTRVEELSNLSIFDHMHIIMNKLEKLPEMLMCQIVGCSNPETTEEHEHQPEDISEDKTDVKEMPKEVCFDEEYSDE